MPCRCSSQSFLRFSNARIEVGVIPATYSRSSHNARFLRPAALFVSFLLPVPRFSGAEVLLVAMDDDSFISKDEVVRAHVMFHAAAFQKVQAANSLCAARQVTQYQPRVHEG